ncbi:MAG: hypothetical protein R2701_02280 [Acidimicrobiales bacterium]
MRLLPPRHRAPTVVAASDCERCRDGWITQPANAASSLAYVAAGLDLLRHPDHDRAFALAVAGVGVGSVGLHGPGGVGGKWLHDASLLAMLGLLALSDVTVAEGKQKPPAAVAAVVAGAAVAAHPRTTDAAQVGAGALVAAAEARRFVRSGGKREVLVALPLWTLGASLHLLGRTGQAWCRPGSPFQAHAAWHVVSAVALWTRRRF